MKEIPYNTCDEDDEDSLICEEVSCHSLFDMTLRNFQDKFCPVETDIRPIKCIDIINATLQPTASCHIGHDFGHNDSFIHVREGCVATFKTCTDKAFPVVKPSTIGRPPLSSPFRQPEDGNGDEDALTIGLAVGCGLVAIVAIVLILVYHHRRKHSDDKENKTDNNKKPSAITSGDHVYTDITTLEGVTSGAVMLRQEGPGYYVTIADEIDNYDHCKQQSLDIEQHSGKTDTYDTLNSQPMNVCVINDDTYNTTRETTYDRLHTKENPSVPGNYDVLPGNHDVLPVHDNM
ncbi:uncharacterized protein LOC132550279 [Ylistrum balloti]|uniref:uncharacterized protein LOC132550279 n=1 Tax=Ylistrum balloti TaxID=509963 RepID=UPI002905A8B3|nr:uncharacterized protein LOC132550279 [Ylistrum balloti]